MFYSIFIDLHQFFRRLYISETTKIDIVSCQLPVRQTEWQKKNRILQTEGCGSYTLLYIRIRRYFSGVLANVATRKS